MRLCIFSRKALGVLIGACAVNRANRVCQLTLGNFLCQPSWFYNIREVLGTLSYGTKGHEFESPLISTHLPGKVSLSTQQYIGIFSEYRKDKAGKLRRWIGSPIHLLCPTYSGPPTLTVPMSTLHWETFTFSHVELYIIVLRQF